MHELLQAFGDATSLKNHVTDCRAEVAQETPTDQPTRRPDGISF